MAAQLPNFAKRLWTHWSPSTVCELYLSEALIYMPRLVSYAGSCGWRCRGKVLCKKILTRLCTSYIPLCTHTFNASPAFRVLAPAPGMEIQQRARCPCPSGVWSLVGETDFKSPPITALSQIHAKTRTTTSINYCKIVISVSALERAQRWWGGQVRGGSWAWKYELQL